MRKEAIRWGIGTGNGNVADVVVLIFVVVAAGAVFAPVGTSKSSSKLDEEQSTESGRGSSSSNAGNCRTRSSLYWFPVNTIVLPLLATMSEAKALMALPQTLKDNRSALTQGF